MGSIDTVYKNSSDSETTTVEYNPDFRFSFNENNTNDMNTILLKNTEKNSLALFFNICIAFVVILFVFILIIIILNAVKII